MRGGIAGSFRLALAGAIAALGVCAVAIARAARVEPVPPVATEIPGIVSPAELMSAEASAPRVPSESVLPLETLGLAVDHDPFMPDRRRPAAYTLPGEGRAEPVAARTEPQADPPPFRVIGTALVGDSGVALVQPLESPTVEVVRVGDTVQGYRLASVDNESATLVIRSQTFTLGVQPGSQGIEVGGRNGEAPFRAVLPGGMVGTGAVRQPGITGRIQVGDMTVEIPLGIDLRAGRGRGNLVVPGRRVRPDTSRIELPQSNERN